MEVVVEPTRTLRLKELREERGLSQTRFAGVAGLNPTTVNQIERGTRQPSARTLAKLASALGVSVPDLFGEEVLTPKMTAPPSPVAPEQDADEERRYLIPLLDSYTLILTELSNGHGPRIANISEDLSPSRVFAVYQWVSEFIYHCDLIERALDEKGVMEAVWSLFDRAWEGEHVPDDLLQKAREFGNAHHKLLVDVEVSAYEWIQGQFERPEVMAYSNKEKQEAEKRASQALGHDSVVMAASGTSVTDVRAVTNIAEGLRIKREKAEAYSRRMPAMDTG
jgi:transcriptional regulator with XRE-family HTH domain